MYIFKYLIRKFFAAVNTFFSFAYKLSIILILMAPILFAVYAAILAALYCFPIGFIYVLGIAITYMLSYVVICKLTRGKYKRTRIVYLSMLFSSFWPISIFLVILFVVFNIFFFYYKKLENWANMD